MPAVEHPGRDWEYEDRVSAAGMRHDFVGSESRTVCHIRYLTPAESVECYRAWVTGGGWPLHGLRHRSPSLEAIWAELAGRDLACWCRLDRPCHADVLLELANPGLPTGGERA